MRVLYFDIETSLMQVYTFYIGNKVSIQPNQIKEQSKIICICYKWSDENKVHELRWDPKTQDDSKMLAKFNKIAAKADALCGHNGRGFDVKEIRGAIALRGLAEAWCETYCIDTLGDYRKMFRFKSNRLNAIAQHLGLGHKDPMGMQDWINVSNNDPKALDKMVKYCKKDVKLLEKVHKRLAKYVTPTMTESKLLRLKKTANIKCKTDGCDSKSFIKYGTYTYKKQNYQRYLCKKCSIVNMPEKDNG
jgi:predicted PolB exonuclease-like 3'-5' exonuclease